MDAETREKVRRLCEWFAGAHGMPAYAVARGVHAWNSEGAPQAILDALAAEEHAEAEAVRLIVYCGGCRKVTRWDMKTKRSKG